MEFKASYFNIFSNLVDLNCEKTQLNAFLQKKFPEEPNILKYLLHEFLQLPLFFRYFKDCVVKSSNSSSSLNSTSPKHAKNYKLHQFIRSKTLLEELYVIKPSNNDNTISISINYSNISERTQVLMHNFTKIENNLFITNTNTNILGIPKFFDTVFDWSKIDIFASKNIMEEINDKLLNYKEISPFLIAEAYEYSKLKEQKQTRQQGVFYTPPSESKFTIYLTLMRYIRSKLDENDIKSDLIIQEILYIIFNNDYHLNNKSDIVNILSNIIVLDPACGNGIFLYETARLFLKILDDDDDINILDVFPTIIGVDIDSCCLKLCLLRLWDLFFIHYGLKPQVLSLFSRVQCISGDFIIENQTILNKTDESIIEKIKNLHGNIDLIVGNPPYIRNRNIHNPKFNSNRSNKEYRKLIRKSLKNISSKWEEIAFSKTMDYSLYFLLHCLAFLKSGGVLGFIVSNSWLNVKYGYSIQELLLKYFNFPYFIDNQSRSFKSADINTIIQIIEKPYSENLDNVSNFSIFKKDFKKLQKLDDLTSIFEILFNTNHASKNLSSVEDFQYEEYKLWENHIFGRDYIRKFIGSSWGNYFFLAPPFYHEFLKRLGDEILRIGDIANIKRGITTNCNDYFILEKVCESPPQFENGYGDIIELESDVLKKMIRSPRQIESPKPNLDDINTFLFYTSYSKEELKNRNLQKTLEYVEYGEKRNLNIKKGSQRGKEIVGVCNLASFKSKYAHEPNSWYCLKKVLNIPQSFQKTNKRDGIIYIQKIFNENYKFAVSKQDNFIANNTFYEISLKPKYQKYYDFFSLILLSSISALSIELEGRTNFGGGALDTATFDISNIITLNPAKLSTEEIQTFVKKCKSLFEKPFESYENLIQSPIIKHLDEFVMKKLGLNYNVSHLQKTTLNIQQRRIKKKIKFSN